MLFPGDMSSCYGHISVSVNCIWAQGVLLCSVSPAVTMQWVCLTHNACMLLQIAPVVDASSAQSRADVLAIGLSAVVLLIGLQWISLTPRTPVQASAQRMTLHALRCARAMEQQSLTDLPWRCSACKSCAFMTCAACSSCR